MYICYNIYIIYTLQYTTVSYSIFEDEVACHTLSLFIAKGWKSAKLLLTPFKWTVFLVNMFCFSISCGYHSISFNQKSPQRASRSLTAGKIAGFSIPAIWNQCGLAAFLPSGQGRSFRYAPHQNLGNQCQRPSESLNDQPQNTHIQTYKTHQNSVFNFESPPKDPQCIKRQGH